MTIRVNRLLAGAALLCMVPTLAQAQVAGPSVGGGDATNADEDIGEDVVVLGFGQSRQVQTVSDLDIDRLTPGTSPIKAVQKLPGVNFQSADAFGAYEWAVRISLRGFNQNQLGFTLDGIPLGDMSYGNANGLHVSRAIISENVGTVTVAQGAGALGEASTNNLGGTLQFTSRTPGDALGVFGSGTYGSDDTYRAFVRIESGDLTGNGLKGYVSYGYLNAGKWKGFGEQRTHQANAKIVQEIGDGSISAFFNYSDRREQDYQDLSLDSIRRLGLGLDNISNDFVTAQQIARVYQNQSRPTGAPLPFPTAGLVFPSPYQTVDDTYFDAAGLREDYLAGAALDIALAPAVSLKLTGYYHGNRGQGIWYTPYVPTPGGSPISVRTTEYDIDRGGVIARLGFEIGANQFEIGGWYETNGFQQARRFYGLANAPQASLPTLEYKTNPFFTQWEFDFDTKTTLYYVSDRVELGDLTLSGGWKGYRVVNRADPIVAGGLASGRIDATDWFLPQVGALYRVGEAGEVFASFTQNMRAFTSASTGGPFATTQAGFNAIRGTLRPERSDTYEVGGRFRSGSFQASAAAYYVNFTNRLLAFTNGAGIVGNPVTLQNVGDVRNIGLELTAVYRPIRAFSLLATYAYNDSEYRDNVLSATGAIVTATAGKTVVDSPRHMLKGELVYDDQRFLVRVGADYMSKRFFNYLNDRSVGGRVIVDATIGYRFGGEGLLKGFAIEGSVTNLTDLGYVSTIGSNGYGASGDNQTLLAGAPRQFFATLKKGF